MAMVMVVLVEVQADAAITYNYRGDGPVSLVGALRAGGLI
jgi:hypothetical protein